MNKVCRNQFVNLHSQPILENLSKHFEQTYVTYDAIPTDSDLARAKVLFKNIPEKGELNLDVVKDSVYFFSWWKYILWEASFLLCFKITDDLYLFFITLDSGINVVVRLLILGLFSSAKSLLKRHFSLLFFFGVY